MIILIGASNLTRGLPTVIGLIQSIFDPPLQILAAYGHGRSYGLRSRVLMRELPPILDCELWKAIDRIESPRHCFALITDIGNDIIYGQEVETIARWIETCLDRLDSIGAKTIMTQLPIESIRSLSRTRFEIARRLIFPSHSIDFEYARSKAEALNEAVAQLARERGGEALLLPRAWYGLDPVHIRKRCERDAWREILNQWNASESNRAPRTSLARWITLRRARPAHRWMFGREEFHSQPACELPDGTSISVF